jgi:rifampicin phosphotransferase
VNLVSLVSRLPGGNVVRLGSPRCTNDTAGGKARRLSELLRAGYRVPRGQVVTLRALSTYCAHNRVRLDGPSEHVARGILAGSFPAGLLEELYGAFDQLACDTIAIRSSGLGEDGSLRSMAGQLKTFLNVPPREALDRIKQCWSAAFNPAAVAYAKRHGISQHWRMAVLLQEQVDASHAGVLFTLDPTLRSSERMVLEWVEGVGEPLVSGHVTPERAYLRRKSFELPENLPAALQAVLPELHRAALELERQQREPLDIEWCVDGGGLHWLQARPITGLAKHNSVVWTNVNMIENFPAPLTPFTWSVVDRFFKAYLSSGLRAFGTSERQSNAQSPLLDQMTGVHCGRVYYNLTSWHALLGLAPCADYLRRCLDDYIGHSIPLTATNAMDVSRHKRVGRFWLQVARGRWRARAGLDDLEREFEQARQRWRAVPYAERELAELVTLIEDIFGFVEHRYAPAVMADFFAMVFPATLKALALRWAPERPGLALELLHGVEVPTTEAVRLMREIARQIDMDGLLRSLLFSGQYDELETTLPQRTRHLFERFFSRFGSRCYNGGLLTFPTFEERHELFWDLIKKCCDDSVRYPWPGVAKARRDVRTPALAALPAWQRAVLTRLLVDVDRALALRERGRLVQSMIFGELRQILLQIGQRLAAWLPSADDVFFLELSEVLALTRGKLHSYQLLSELVVLRRRAHEHNATLEPAELVILDRGQQLGGCPANTDAAPTVATRFLAGDAVAGGRCRGRARVIVHADDWHRLQSGDVLVTRTTDPGWMPLFLLASGLILEKGGMLSHGAIVARELGIPAVVGIADATRKISDGSWVDVDGHSGEVCVLDDENAGVTARV